jgi:hypothetical protein
VLSTVAVGSAPSAIAIGGGLAWIADAGSNDVRSISLTTLRVAGSPIADTGRQPVAITYGSDGTVWLANRASSDVVAIRGRRAGRPLFVSGGPISVAAGPVAHVWAGTASSSVVRVDRPSTPIALHAGPVVVTAVGATVWALTRDNAILASISARGSGSGTVTGFVRLSPAETPTSLACGPHLCIAGDELTRQVVAAAF